MSSPTRQPAKRKRRHFPSPYGRGRTIYQTPQGWIAYFRPPHGVMERHRCATYDEARMWLEALASPLPPLSNARYAEAQSACALLPEGVSLVEAARAWLASSKKAKPVTVAEAVKEFKTARAPLLKPASLSRYSSVLGRFAASVGGERLLSGVHPEDVSAFVADATPSTRNTLLRHLSGFFSWALKREWTLENPCKKVEKARNVEAPRGVLSPDETAALLHAAEKCAPDAVAPLAVQLFAGVRPAEIVRLPDGAVANGYVVLDGNVTKTANARTVEIRPNLAAWLEAYPYRRLAYSPLRTGTEKARKAAKLVHWPADCLRHSFATYAYELGKNAAAVAADMGHGGTDVFFRHYRALAKPGDGEKYFGILPAVQSVCKKCPKKALEAQKGKRP